MSNSQLILALGLVFLAVGVVGASAFQFAAPGVSLGVVLVVLGVAFMAHSRRSLL